MLLCNLYPHKSTNVYKIINKYLQMENVQNTHLSTLIVHHKYMYQISLQIECYMDCITRIHYVNAKYTNSQVHSLAWQ